MKIACVGDNCVDSYDNTGEAFLGGNPLNVSVYLRRLGCRASYTGAVGEDRYGKMMKEALDQKGVDTSHLKVLPGNTALTHVEIVNGDRVFGDYEEGVMADFAIDEDDRTFLLSHDLIVAGLWSHMESELEGLQERGGQIAFDFADRPYDPEGVIAMPHVDIAFFSDDSSDDEALKEIILDIASHGAGLVVATRGEHGSLAWDGRQWHNYGIKPCEVVDTMGAGDSYIAGFLYAYLQKMPVDACMEAGAASSAITLGYAGAW